MTYLTKKKKKKSICICQIFASVQVGSIFSSSGVPGPWVISRISFSTPSKSGLSIACHLTSRMPYHKATLFPVGFYSFWLDFSHRLCALFITAFSRLFWPAVWTGIVLGFGAVEIKATVYVTRSMSASFAEGQGWLLGMGSGNFVLTCFDKRLTGWSLTTKLDQNSARISPECSKILSS